MSHNKEEKNKKFEYAVRMSLSLCYTVYIEILTDSLRFHIVFFHWNGSVSHANEHLINTNNDFSRISFSSFFSFNLEEISTLWWHCLNWMLLLGFLLCHIWDRISGWYWVKVEHNTTHFSPYVAAETGHSMKLVNLFLQLELTSNESFAWLAQID